MKSIITGVLSCVRPSFDLGHVVGTPNALGKIRQVEILSALARHVKGDWGELDPQDWIANDQAFASGGRLLSAYTSQGGVRFWILTEADRSVTTILLPEDY